MDGRAFSDILKVFTQHHLVHTGGAGSQAVGDKAGYALIEFSPSQLYNASHPNCPCSPMILLQLAVLLPHRLPPGFCLWSL